MLKIKNQNIKGRFTPLFLLVFLLVFLNFNFSTAAETTFIVDSEDFTADATTDGICADALGNCTLPAAIREANNIGASGGLVNINIDPSLVGKTITYTGTGLPGIEVKVNIVGPTSGEIVLDCSSLALEENKTAFVFDSTKPEIQGTTISGFNITGCPTAVGAVPNNASITDLTVTTGNISLSEDTTGVVVSNNTITNGQIVVNNASSATISNNIITNTNQTCVQARLGDDSTISDNVLTHTLAGSATLELIISGEKNIIFNNTVNGSIYAVSVDDVLSDLTIIDNTINNSPDSAILFRGQGVLGISNILIDGNQITAASDNGIDLSLINSGSGIIISNNTVSSSFFRDIIVANTSNLEISDNNIVNSEGSGAISCEKLTGEVNITGNTITGIWSSGIYLTPEVLSKEKGAITSGSIASNTISGFTNAIYIDDRVSGLSISNNIITNSVEHAVYLGEDFSNNDFSLNTITAGSADIAYFQTEPVLLTYNGQVYDQDLGQVNYYIGGGGGDLEAVNTSDTAITSSNGYNNFNLALVNVNSGALYATVFVRDDAFEDSTDFQADCESWKDVTSCQIDVWQDDVWLVDGTGHTWNLTATNVTASTIPSIDYIGTDFSYAAFYVLGSDNTFDQQVLRGIENGYFFTESASGNIISKNTFDQLGVDVKQYGTSEIVVNYLSNTVFENTTVSTGVLDVNYDVRAHLVNEEGKDVSDIDVIAIDVADIETSLGKTTLTGLTDYVSLDAYQIISSGFTNIKNDYELDIDDELYEAVENSFTVEEVDQQVELELTGNYCYYNDFSESTFPLDEMWLALRHADPVNTLVGGLYKMDILGISDLYETYGWDEIKRLMREDPVRWRGLRSPRVGWDVVRLKSLVRGDFKTEIKFANLLRYPNEEERGLAYFYLDFMDRYKYTRAYIMITDKNYIKVCYDPSGTSPETGCKVSTDYSFDSGTVTIESEGRTDDPYDGGTLIFSVDDQEIHRMIFDYLPIIGRVGWHVDAFWDFFGYKIDIDEVINSYGCTTTQCGNDIVEWGEYCDDGNRISEDGCDKDCRIEPFPGQCSNDIDDDHDGACDYDGCTYNGHDLPPDVSCSDADDWDELEPLAICQDSSDNDNDVYVDYTNDPGCQSSQDEDEVNTDDEAYCGDSILDLELYEECDDGNDISGDGCSPLCFLENEDYQCSDGLDNDSDGLIDLQDAGCKNPLDNDEQDPPTNNNQNYNYNNNSNLNSNSNSNNNSNSNQNNNQNNNSNLNSSSNLNINSFIVNNKNINLGEDQLQSIEINTNEDLVLEGMVEPNTRVVITLVDANGQEVTYEVWSDELGYWKIVIAKDILAKGNYTIYLQTEINGQLSERIELSKLIVKAKSIFSTFYLVILIIVVILLILVIAFVIYRQRKKGLVETVK